MTILISNKHTLGYLVITVRTKMDDQDTRHMKNKYTFSASLIISLILILIFITINIFILIIQPLPTAAAEYCVRFFLCSGAHLCHLPLSG